MARQTKASTEKKAKTTKAKPAKSAQPKTTAKPEVDSEIMERVGKLRSHLRETFGQVVMAMMGLPRYRYQSVMDLNHIVLEPLIRDRIAIAHTPKDETANDVAGIALWASVSEEVDAKIVEQIKAGVFPIRLKAEDWTSGDINWLLDVLATDRETTGKVLGNFKQVVKEGELKVHPLISRLVDKAMLDKMTKHTAPSEE